MRAITASTIVIAFAFLIIASFMSSGIAASQTGCVQALASGTTHSSWTDDCAARNRQDAYARYFTFRLGEQADVTIALESATDPYLFLSEGDGADGFLAENDDIAKASRNYNSLIAITLAPGNYIIEATTYDKLATGDFTLTVTGVDFSAPADSDRAALVALYHATDGDNWTYNTNWLTDAPLDEWYGVDERNDGRIVEIELGRNQLAGSIPPELGNLEELERLYLAHNQLTGEIPPELGNLTNLIELALDHNQLTGEIPPELGNLINLYGLFLNHNRLTGEILSELGNLINLEELWLGNNQLT